MADKFMERAAAIYDQMHPDQAPQKPPEPQRIVHENQDSLKLETTAKGAVLIELKLYGQAEEIVGRATTILDGLRERYKSTTEPSEFYRPK